MIRYKKNHIDTEQKHSNKSIKANWCLISNNLKKVYAFNSMEISLSTN